MSTVVSKIYSVVLHLSILTFTSALVWFAFVYYPKIVSDYKTGNFPKKQLLPAVAASYQFPIETSGYKITWEKSGTYYVFVRGKTLDEYLVNRDGARLALKTALSKSDLCDTNVLYVSTKNLQIPKEFQDNGC